MEVLKKIISFVLDIFFIGLPVFIIFWFAFDFIIFNRCFLGKEGLNVLYYVLPIITGLLLSVIVAVWVKKMNKYTQMVFILLSACYQFVSLWFTITVFCDKNQNLNLDLKIFVWISIVISLVTMLVRNFKRLSFRDISLINIVFFIWMIDFLFFEIIADFLLSLLSKEMVRGLC
ncbi:hypothetical protein Q763_00250 [Flavobacterium beibuense F44-8]|uniref:Uncharacterized protein n=1 Tax=Flavobacterium beibuense F44-8 TaxID=1406840 RepID=A0A0A2LY18_9FLAO|nr:hypothetical protein Q763_00250 [Flavobacterium beibuense F44-8]